MAVGVSVAMATARLNIYRATAYPAVSVFVKLHTDVPGAAGATGASAVTTRNAATFNAPSGTGPVTMTLATLGSFSMTTTETITHISLWDASTAGNFLESAALTAGVPVINGSTLTFSSLTISESPVAA
jgi:hypothetical protein